MTLQDFTRQNWDTHSTEVKRKDKILIASQIFVAHACQWKLFILL